MLTQLELDVLSRIKPSDEEYELVRRVYATIAGALRSVLAEHGVEAEVTLQGSVAHDTWLSGSRDIDVFVLFPESWTREDLETRALPLLVEAARRAGEYTLMYAEHPYVRVRVDGVEADVVPAIRVGNPSQIRTAVDRTPFHTEYVSRVLTREQRDHVRLLKRFMKSIGVYGAEVKVYGFSGYAAELLVATYGGFRGVLEAASRWRPPVFVSTVPLTPQLRSTLTSRYPDSCIYMPDPVDPERNVTASVGPRSLATFMLAAGCYLRNPGPEFFQEPPEPTVEEVLRTLENRCVVFLVYRLRDRLPPDSVWGEVQRVASRLYRMAGVLGINIVDYSAWTDEAGTAVVAVELDRCELPRHRHRRGPCVSGGRPESIVGFVEKHLGRGAVWVGHDGCVEAIDVAEPVGVAELIESRWRDYTVSPHFRGAKPVVAPATREIIEELLSMGAGRWLHSFVVKTPYWMTRCSV